ncbi:helix-turn-helix domain-containing protein [Asticcacaulis sp. ZE23SCel15]|uniref:helix-turn-helix domain-containing protein n=1 Tax=Asticcacaulis sp. ZE23SCel15 TaxID=3059027 RepID=UPI00265F273C|nr:helix-turn-helix domain-containing protein [Asticcacaulis sp. ZE23SCel15]WKL57258.1 helix-turn-helix domain-containing protein [Asticcacaulis sp. ZE23SCel15]
MTRLLTPCEAKCLKVLERLTADGVAPSYDEIARGYGCAKSQAHRMVTGLIEKGYVKQGHRGARGLEVVLRRADLNRHMADLVTRHGYFTVEAALKATISKAVA